MLAKDNQVTVLHLHLPGTLPVEEPAESMIGQGIRVRRIPFSLTNIPTLLKSLHTLRQLQNEADILHTSAFPTLVATAFTRITLPWVHTEHASKIWSTELNWRGRAARSLLLMQFRRPDVIVAVSKALATEIEQHHPKRPVRVVPNQVQIQDEQSSLPISFKVGDPIRLVGVGMLTPAKGVLEAVETVHHLVKLGFDVHLEWVGYGPLESQIKRLANTLGIADRVNLLGLVPYSEVPSILRRANMFLAPTVSETFGTAIAEAIGHGLPVVATGHGGHLGYLPPLASRIAPSRSAEDLSNAVLELALDPLRWSAEEIVAYAEKTFSESVRRSSYSAIYTELQPR